MSGTSHVSYQLHVRLLWKYFNIAQIDLFNIFYIFVIRSFNFVTHSILNKFKNIDWFGKYLKTFLQSLADVKMFCLTYYLIQWYLHLNDLNLNQIKQKYVQIDRLIFQWNKSSYFVTSYFSFHNLYALASIYDHCLSNYLSTAEMFFIARLYLLLF